MKPGVSVIICCYNSAKRLPETLRHLALQEVPTNIPWEIIVINNASSDNTVEVAEYEWAKYNLAIPFRIIEQPKAGLSNARDKGFEVAAYEYCLFCDDDNWLQNDYVRITFETMESDPMIGAVGGQGEPVFEGVSPVWFEEYKGLYAVDSQGNVGDITRGKGHLYGAGMAVRKFGYERILEGYFANVLSDRIGSSLSSGGDTEICFALVLAGYKIYFNPQLHFKHFITKNRLNKAYLVKLKLAISGSWILLQPYLYAMKGKEYDKFTWYKDVIYKSFSFFRSFNQLLLFIIGKESFFSAFLGIKAQKEALITILMRKKLYESTIFFLSHKNNPDY